MSRVLLFLFVILGYSLALPMAAMAEGEVDPSLHEVIQMHMDDMQPQAGDMDGGAGHIEPYDPHTTGTEQHHEDAPHNSAYAGMETAGHGSNDGHHGEDHAGSGGGLPQLDLKWFPSQIFWLGLMFALLYTVFSGKILPRIASNLQNREQNIQNDLDTAEKLTHDAAEFQKSYEAALQTARSDAAQMMSDLEDGIRKDQEEIQSAFQKKAEEKIGKTRTKLEKTVGNSMKEIESHIEETALIAAKNIAGIDTDGKAVKAALKAVNSNIKAEAA